MTAPALARLTTALVLGAGGAVLGHVLNPAPGGAVRPARLVAFALALAALGAWRGWREAAVRAEWRGAPRPPARARAGAVAAGAAAALAAAAAAYAVAHGRWG